MKILVTGKGGREHAILTALKENSPNTTLYAWPGSDAIANIATRVTATDLIELIAFMQREQIDLCVAGEESWLVKDRGLANLCSDAGIPCWGPLKQAAQLEASKTFAKNFLQRHHIPTAKFTVAHTQRDALRALGTYPIVLKFDGLAAGKGVAVCQDETTATQFIDNIFNQQIFGAGDLIIEECLTGPEISIFVSVSGDQYHILMPARDYKRIHDNDQGPNTGGMGAVASRDIISPELLNQIEQTIVQPTVKGLQQDGLTYHGFLYFGLMLTPNGPHVIEYNCRFGDPEAEAVLPMIQGDFANYLLTAAQGNLNHNLIQFRNGWSICLILASHGYPASSRNGDPISGLEKLTHSRTYHCGTRKNTNNQFETNGGRVLALVAHGDTRQNARQAVYADAQHVTFPGRQNRSDIGQLHFE